NRASWTGRGATAKSTAIPGMAGVRGLGAIESRFGNERRQRDQVEIPRLFRRERPRGGAVVSARAAQRSHLDVHQCRHGAIQERLYRLGEAPPFSRGPRAK